MTKKEITNKLAKEIALLSKEIAFHLQDEDLNLEVNKEYQKQLIKNIQSEINGIKKAAMALNIKTEEKIMPIVRHLVTLSTDEIKAA